MVISSTFIIINQLYTTPITRKLRVSIGYSSINMLYPVIPAVIKITIFNSPKPLRMGAFGLDLINATTPRADMTMVNSAKNKPINMAAGILASLPHLKVIAANTILRLNTTSKEGRNKRYVQIFDTFNSAI